jgi:hypothetical protein
MRPDKKGLKMKKKLALGLVLLWILNLGYLSCEEFPAISMGQISYPIVGTHQSQYFNESGKEISSPLPGSSLFGQDAHYPGIAPSYQNNGDGTVTDLNTALMWMKIDSGTLKAGDQKDGKLNWYQALEWAENLSYADYNDWRLPNAKELQSIVDYSRCPDITNSAAIDPVFQSSEILNEAGKKDYPFYWTNTTHINGQGGLSAVYITFGRALGWMAPPNGGKKSLLDVHGAGAQRSDPKKGNPDNYPEGHGPQGDVIRIYHMVRCVRK